MLDQTQRQERREYWQEIRQQLAAPFEIHELNFKPQNTYEDKGWARIVTYLDARAYFERLDEVLGVGAWQVKHDASGSQLITRIDVWDPFIESWVTKEDGGHVGGNRDGQGEQTKGTLSDGVKRAGVALGIGRYLYRMPAFLIPWRPGQKYIPWQHEDALREAVPSWALPDGSGYPDTPRDVIDLRNKLGSSSSSSGNGSSEESTEDQAGSNGTGRQSEADQETGELPATNVPTLLSNLRKQVNELGKRNVKPLTSSERGKLIKAIEYALDSANKLEAEQVRQARHAVYVAIAKTPNPHEEPAIERALFGWVKPYAVEQDGSKIWRASKATSQQIRDIYREFIVKAPQDDLEMAFDNDVPEGVTEARAKVA